MGLKSPQCLELLRALPTLKVAHVRMGWRVLSEQRGVEEPLATYAAHVVLHPQVPLGMLGAVRLGLEPLVAVGPRAAVGVLVGVLGLVAVQFPHGLAAERTLLAEEWLGVIVAAAHVRLEGRVSLEGKATLKNTT